MKLIAISDPDVIAEEANILNALFGEGLETLHLRKPEWEVEQLRRLLDKLSPSYLERISLHQHHHLAENYGISRLHFPEQRRKDIDENALEELVNKGICLSSSVHDLATLKGLSSCFDYCFFGPVFNSISKKGYRAAVDSNFHLEDEQKPVAVIALGGVDTDTIENIRRMNFDGAAVLGALWKEPQKAVKAFQVLTKKITENHDC